MVFLYRLEGTTVIPVDENDEEDRERCARCDHRVACDETPGGAEVSTVFLRLNHNFGEGPPLVFETMIFGGPLGGEGRRYQNRYSTWDEAVSGHARALAAAIAAEAS